VGLSRLTENFGNCELWEFNSLYTPCLHTWLLAIWYIAFSGYFDCVCVCVCVCVCALELMCFLQPNAAKQRLLPPVVDDDDETGSGSESPCNVNSWTEESDAEAAAAAAMPCDNDYEYVRGTGCHVNLFSY